MKNYIQFFDLSPWALYAYTNFTFALNQHEWIISNSNCAGSVSAYRCHCSVPHITVFQFSSEGTLWKVSWNPFACLDTHLFDTQALLFPLLRSFDFVMLSTSLFFSFFSLALFSAFFSFFCYWFSCVILHARQPPLVFQIISLFAYTQIDSLLP